MTRFRNLDGSGPNPGSTQSFTQSISDWAIPQGYAGESTALATAYRDTAVGTQQVVTLRIYEYTFALDPTKAVRSLTLPKDDRLAERIEAAADNIKLALRATNENARDSSWDRACETLQAVRRRQVVVFF